MQGPDLILTLGLVVVHSILPGQWLDQVLEGHVTAHIVAAANGALDLWDTEGAAEQQPSDAGPDGCCLC
jgi:hypothetical protein